MIYKLTSEGTIFKEYKKVKPGYIALLSESASDEKTNSFPLFFSNMTFLQNVNTSVLKSDRPECRYQSSTCWLCKLEQVASTLNFPFYFWRA